MPHRPPLLWHPAPLRRGSAQACALAYGLWLFATNVEAAIEAQSLPEAYTVRRTTARPACTRAHETNPCHTAQVELFSAVYMLVCLMCHTSVVRLSRTALRALGPAARLLLLIQARNIAITVRTIIIGLSYLVTFIFAANGVGLAGAPL